jgi:hypothetical protein
MPLLDDALLVLWQRMREAQHAYDAAMNPARAALARAKATGDASHITHVYRRDFEPVWFAADVAYRAARDAAERAFRDATGREPFERFNDEPFIETKVVER